MFSGRRRALRAVGELDLRKKDVINHIPGILGIPIDGASTVEVPDREGYVYVRLRHSTSELIQAYNDQVSPVYGLPVLVKKDDLDPNRYVVAGRDLGVYQNWGNSPYLPRHGNTHSFWDGGGGDVVWVYDRQLMPLLAHPSGSVGACNVVIEPYHYYQDGQWKYGGGTGTADICSLKPTDGTAKIILLYLDSNTNPQLLAGSTFAATITGTAQILPFVPALPDTSAVPLAFIRLVSGTSKILWANIYDGRPWIVGDGVLTTGTSRHIIQDEGVNETDRPYLNFQGTTVFVVDDAGNNRTNIIISGSAGGSGHTIQNEGTPVTDRAALNFIGSTIYVVDDAGNDRTNVIVSGSSGGWASGARVRCNANQVVPTSFIGPVHFNQEIYDTDGYFTIVTGTATRLTVPETGVYLIAGNVGFDYSLSGTARGIEIVKNGVTTTGDQVYLGVVGDAQLSISAIERLLATEYVELHAYQDTGGNLNAQAFSTNFAIQRIG